MQCIAISKNGKRCQNKHHNTQYCMCWIHRNLNNSMRCQGITKSGFQCKLPVNRCRFHRNLEINSKPNQEIDNPEEKKQTITQKPLIVDPSKTITNEEVLKIEEMITGSDITLNEINGINSFALLRVENSKILILGESHSFINVRRESDNYVVKWLYKLSKYAPTCFNLFIEQNRGVVEEKPIISPMTETMILFEKYNRFNETCEFSEVMRYHLIDLRIIDGIGAISGIGVALVKAIQGGKQEALKFMNSYNSEMLNDMIEYASGLKNNDKGKRNLYRFYDYLNSHLEIKFDLKMYEEYRERMIPILKKAIRKIPNFDLTRFMNSLKFSYNKLKDGYLKCSQIIISINMDVYMLLRYLMIYDADKMNRGPIKCRSPEFQQAKYSIIYCGDTHAQNYRNFFEHYFSITPDIYVQNETKNIGLYNFNLFN